MKYPSIEKWREYETEKRKIEERNLTPEQYEAAIKELCEKLKI
jgi:hypothetical protein